MHYEIVTVVVVDVGRRFQEGVETGVKLARSAPPYANMLPKYRELAHDLMAVDGSKVHVITKFYEPDIIVVEAHAIVGELFKVGILDFKKSMLGVCYDVAARRDFVSDIYEEYTMFCISGYKNISQFDRQKAHIVGLMRNEVEEMDRAVVESALRDSSLKYSANDLVVVGWDSAIMFSDQANEFSEIIEVLITGNIQLLQVRLLNRELESGLDFFNKSLSGKKFQWLRLRNILNQIIVLRTRSLFELESTKSNINLLGDWYTANLYALTAKKFHLDEKISEVHKRFDALEDVYDMYSQRLNNNYMLVLEFLITVMILYEIIVALV